MNDMFSCDKLESHAIKEKGVVGKDGHFSHLSDFRFVYLEVCFVFAAGDTERN